MPRALAAFQKVGLGVTPAATDLCFALPIPQSPRPSAGCWGTRRTTSAIKKMIGLCIYRLRAGAPRWRGDTSDRLIYLREGGRRHASRRNVKAE